MRDKHFTIKGRQKLDSRWAPKVTHDEYIKRRLSITNLTRDMNKIWKSQWLIKTRVIAQGYDKLVEYRVVTGLDDIGHEWETRWYADWDDEKGIWAYLPETLDNAQWEKVDTPQRY
jgi:hypothetical protein